MSDPQVQETPEQLAELGAVLLDLAKSKQKAGASAQDLSLYTAAAILYQHVLSICEQNKDVIDNSQAKALADTACQELAQIEQSMLGQATGAEAITPRVTAS